MYSVEFDCLSGYTDLYYQALTGCDWSLLADCHEEDAQLIIIIYLAWRSHSWKQIVTENQQDNARLVNADAADSNNKFVSDLMFDVPERLSYSDSIEQYTNH